jgi:hypothetical protein
MGKTDEELIAQRVALVSRDTDLTAQVKAYGVELDKDRQIDLMFWAPDEAKAKLLVEAMKRNEMPPFLVLGPANEKEADRRWAIRCSITASVKFITTKDNIETFILFADKFDCDYDGWGTPIVEASR